MQDIEQVREDLLSREPIFHHSDKFGTSREDIEAQMCDEFKSIVSTGKVYLKEDVTNILLKRYADPEYIDNWEIKDFEITKIAETSYLVTYMLIHNDKISKRSTIWRLEEGKWKILFHQGTKPEV